MKARVAKGEGIQLKFKRIIKHKAKLKMKIKAKRKDNS